MFQPMTTDATPEGLRRAPHHTESLHMPMTETAARDKAHRLWGPTAFARVVWHSAIASWSHVIVGRNPDTGYLGRGRDWEEAFADAERRVKATRLPPSPAFLKTR
jgi:hypothetical protein